MALTKDEELMLLRVKDGVDAGIKRSEPERRMQMREEAHAVFDIRSRTCQAASECANACCEEMARKLRLEAKLGFWKVVAIALGGGSVGGAMSNLGQIFHWLKTLGH